MVEICAEGNHLAQNDVPASHVLAAHRTEEMSAAEAEMHVCATVFQNMSYVFDAVCVAPFAELFGEIFLP